MIRHPQIRRAGGIALVVIAVAAATGGSIEAYQQDQQAAAIHQGAARQQRVTACQVAFNNAYAAVTVARGKLGDQDRAATAALINTVFTAAGPGARATVLAAYQQYKAAEARITAERAAHPFPALPSAACK